MMSEISAFVGHSFTEDDEEIVHRFLKYFDELKDMNFGFSWVHAEAAEPKILAEKVLALLAGKNVFISICTKKERVVRRNNQTAQSFTNRFLNGNKLRVNGKHLIGSFKKLVWQLVRVSI